jgi:hypothetical protein
LRFELLELDGRAGLLELGLELVGLVALDALLDGLGRLVDEGLGLLQAKAGDGADALMTWIFFLSPGAVMMTSTVLDSSSAAAPGRPGS